MKSFQKYRILCIVTLAFAGGAYYELNYVKSQSEFVPMMAPPNPAAELLIDLYPQRPGSKCLEADRALYLRYDLEAAKNHLEEALNQNYKDDASYFYNYASVLMLLNAPTEDIDEAVRQWRVNGIPIQNELDPRLIYKGVRFPLPLEEGSTRLMTKSLDGRRVAIAPEMNPNAPTLTAQINHLQEPNPAYRKTDINARSRFTALTLSHDGSHVIAANEGGVLTIINLDSQQLLHRLTNSSGDILAAAVVPSRNIAVTGDHSGKIKIWDLTSGSVIHSEQATTRAVSALAVSPNNSIVATGDWDGTVSIWKFKDSGSVERIIQNDKAHQGVITRLVFGSDNETLASASRDHTASIFRYRESLDRLLSVQHRSPIYGIDIAPAGTTFATAGEDQIVSVWSTQTGEQLHVDIHAQPIYSVLFNVKTGELMTVNNQQELINRTPVTR